MTEENKDSEQTDSSNQKNTGGGKTFPFSPCATLARLRQRDPFTSSFEQPLKLDGGKQSISQQQLEINRFNLKVNGAGTASNNSDDELSEHSDLGDKDSGRNQIKTKTRKSTPYVKFSQLCKIEPSSDLSSSDSDADSDTDDDQIGPQSTIQLSLTRQGSP